MKRVRFHLASHVAEEVALHAEYGLLSHEKEATLERIKLTSAIPLVPGLSSWQSAKEAEADLAFFEPPHPPAAP